MTDAFGDPSSPAIVLADGAGTWDEAFCARLAAARRFVVRYDVRGGAELRALVIDALAVLDAHGLDRAHFVGVSRGGAVVQRLALDHPERVAALTVAPSWDAAVVALTRA